MILKKIINGRARKVILLLFDIFCFLSVDTLYYLLALRADFSTPVSDHTGVYLLNSLLLLVSIFVFQLIFSVYANLWRYASTAAYLKIIISDCLGGLTALLLARIFGIYIGIWHAVTVASLSALLSLASRFIYRLLYKRIHTGNDEGRHHINVAIVGAGQLGAVLANDLLCNKNSVYKPVFFVDLDKAKIGGRVANLPVYRNDSGKISELIKKYQVSEIFIAISKINSEKISKLYNEYNKTGCKVKLYDMPIHEDDIPEKKQQRVIREFQIEDLLFRQPLDINGRDALEYYAQKTVLITGGGGSIGSELCRQLAKCGPKKLIILDCYENSAYELEQELRRNYSTDIDIAVEIASVRDRVRLESIFKNYRPDVVFHAAAHKHVPLMEHSGCEAFKNNVVGTYNTADVAEKYGVKKFILISTDKAVNPTNIMGASKRLCEMIVQSRGDSNTCFAAVRFGNVLGSNGSVIPLFKRQIANGGPVTITDKRIIRYFMTIPEASQLVMHAGAMAKKGELFVLDMGRPVRIYDLAKNMIELSGYRPDVDIMIEEIGLRPGEKLYEELLIDPENLDKTDNNMIFVERDVPLSRDEVDGKLAVLQKAADEACDCIGSERIKAAFAEVVPTFHDPKEVNERANSTDEMKSAAL